MAIKIAIIAHACRGGGGLFQTTNLLKALKNVVRDEQFLLVCSAGYGFEKIELPPNSKVFVFQGKHNPLERYWFELVTLPNLIDRYNPDVAYSPGPTGLVNSRVPQTLFIRNAYLFYDKKHYPDMRLRLRLRIAALKLEVRKSLRGTRLIFCQTPIVEQRFSEKYDYPRNQMRVLGFPPPAEMPSATNLEAPCILDKKLGDFRILMLTEYMPHKNPGILIPLCERYDSQIREKQIRFITTVEPEDHPRAEKFLKEVSRRGLGDVIINAGKLSRKDVSRYLRHSDILWLPTLLECLPTTYLEAMSVGAPILAPDLDFARYTCDEAAVYYDPWDVDSIFEKIMFMRENPQIRRGLAEKGKLQLQNREKFPESWEEVAAITLQELRKLAK
jgi:glycosyltransferase involved in cell wall biosynthesis